MSDEMLRINTFSIQSLNIFCGNSEDFLQYVHKHIAI